MLQNLHLFMQNSYLINLIFTKIKNIYMSHGLLKGKKGIKLKKPKHLINQFEYFFGEDQSRYIVEVEKENLKKVEEILKKNSVHFDEIGEISNEDLTFDDKTKVSIDELYISNNNWLTNYMSK